MSDKQGKQGFALVCCKYHPDAPLAEEYHAGDLVCTECGVVAADRVIDVGSEWRTFSDDSSSKNNSRVGQAESYLYSNDLGTVVEVEKGAPKVFTQTKANIEQKALNPVFKEISSIANRLGLPPALIDNIKSNYKKIYDSKTVKKKNNVSISAACILLTCRQHNRACAMSDIMGASEVNAKDFHRAIKIATRSLHINLPAAEKEFNLATVCARLDSRDILKIATHVMKHATEIHELQSRSPVSLVAASIYLTAMATNKDIAISKISEASSAAESTIKTVYKIMRLHAASLFPEDFKFVTPIAQLPK